MTSPIYQLVAEVKAAMAKYDASDDHDHRGAPRPGDCLRCALKPFEPLASAAIEDTYEAQLRATGASES